MLLADAPYIFWSEPAGAGFWLKRRPKGGSGADQNIHSSEVHRESVHVDGAYVYGIVGGGGTGCGSCKSTRVLKRRSYDGSGSSEDILTGECLAGPVVGDDAYLYLTST